MTDEEPQDLSPAEESEEENPKETEENEDETQEQGNMFDGVVEEFDPTTMIDIVTDMEDSYLSYAMSVIVSRALPDVRDGLKPVHRRILYAMHENGLSSGARYRKSANVVGAVMAKYHPHGDSAIYMSMVRMAQEFSLRYPLVDGQGNFGSVDGDNPAAMRYTEARMTKAAGPMLADIEKKTVDFRDNYDATTQEPSVLPAAVPQLLLNGTMGIAVGMATNIPPHNLNEVMGATIHLLQNPEATVDDLLGFIKGPDFPTGAEAYDGGAVKEMYHTGRGGIVMRAKTHTEEFKNGRMAIIVTEIPYQVNKAEMIIKMADLVRDKKMNGISDLRDESNREGIRVVIELKRDAFPNKVLNQLFRDTVLQKTFNLNMIALVDGIHPRLLNLKEVIQYFLDHKLEVVRRRLEYDLSIAEARAHILEGLKIALDNIDAVVETIKKSKNKDEASEQLQKKFKLTEIQAKAILEMRLQSLTGLEREKLENELTEKLALIKHLKGILDSKEKTTALIQKEFEEIVAKFGDARRTKIHPHGLGKFSAKDTIPDEDAIMVLTKQNYVKRMNPNAFRTQKRGGVGVIGAKTKDEDIILKSIYGTNHNDLLFFTNFGRVFALPMYEIPESSRQAKGTPVVNLLQLQPNEKVTEVLNLSRSQGEYIFMCTTGGTVKKTPMDQFQNIRRSGLIACGVREGETLQWAKVSSGEDNVFIVTHNGQSIRFSEEDVRPMGRSAAGVRGIRLKGDDAVVEMDLLHSDDAHLLTVMENGLGKMTKVSEYRNQSRGGSGIKVASVTKKTGKIAGARVIKPDAEGDLLLISHKGQTIRMPLKDMKVSGRNTQGVILMRSGKGEMVASISLMLQITINPGEAAEKDAQEQLIKEEKPKK